MKDPQAYEVLLKKRETQKAKISVRRKIITPMNSQHEIRLPSCGSCGSQRKR